MSESTKETVVREKTEKVTQNIAMTDLLSFRFGFNEEKMTFKHKKYVQNILADTIWPVLSYYMSANKNCFEPLATKFIFSLYSFLSFYVDFQQ